MRTDRAYEGKRQEILAAALGIFSERGFEGTTLEAVADALGCTKPALYHYFKNKDELFSSLILDSLRRGCSQVEGICSREAPAGDKLRDLIRAFLDDHFLNRGYFSIMHQLRGFREKLPPGPVREEMDRLALRIPRSILGIIAQGVEAGEFRDEDPRALGGIVLGMLSGVIIHIDTPALAGMGRERLKSVLDEVIVKGISA